MHSRETALEIIARISRKPAASLTEDMELVADLGFDSARAVELLVALEDALEFEIDEDDATTFNTVGDIISYISALGI